MDPLRRFEALVAFETALVQVLIYGLFRESQSNPLMLQWVSRSLPLGSFLLNGWVLLSVGLGLVAGIFLGIVQLESARLTPPEVGPWPDSETKTVGIVSNELKKSESRFRRALRQPKSTVVLIATGAVLVGISVLAQRSLYAFIGAALVFLGMLPFYVGPSTGIRGRINTSAYFEILRSLVPEETRVVYATSADQESEINAYLLGGAQISSPPISTGATILIGKAIQPWVRRVSAPGEGLLARFERAFNVELTEVRPSYLLRRLPKVMVEDLGLGSKISFENSGARFILQVEQSPYAEGCENVARLGPPFDSLGCDLCSSVAMALAKSSGRPVTIDDTIVSVGESKIQTTFRLLDIEPNMPKPGTG